MGDGVDDWLILTAIQKSLIHYIHIDNTTNIIKIPNLIGLGFLNGGGGGIRTHGTLARSTVFKTAPINRSGTPPSNRFRCIIILPVQYKLSRTYFKLIV